MKVVTLAGKEKEAKKKGLFPAQGERNEIFKKITHISSSGRQILAVVCKIGE